MAFKNIERTSIRIFRFLISGLNHDLPHLVAVPERMDICVLLKTVFQASIFDTSLV